MVPIAPSSTRMRSVSRCSSRVLMCELIFDSRCNQHRKWIARRARANPNFDVLESSADEQAPQILIFEPEPAIADTIAYPFLIVLAEIERQHASARPKNARRLGHGTRGIRRVVQRLREQRDVE